MYRLFLYAQLVESDSCFFFMDDRMHGEKKEQMEKGDGPLHHLNAQILFENLSFLLKAVTKQRRFGLKGNLF